MTGGTPPRFIAVFAATLAASAPTSGCAGTGGTNTADTAPQGTGDSDDDARCDLEVEPTVVSFGDVAIRDIATETVLVRNVGGANCAISALSLQQGYPPFAVGDPSAILLAPAASTDFTVTYYPHHADASADNVMLASDDPVEAELLIPVTGTGLGPEIQLNPAAYDFGAVPVGSVASVDVDLSNTGNTDLVVTEFSFASSSSEFALDLESAANRALPWTLNPGNHRTVTVSYTPVDGAEDEWVLHASSTDPMTPLARARFVGRGG